MSPCEHKRENSKLNERLRDYDNYICSLFLLSGKSLSLSALKFALKFANGCKTQTHTKTKNKQLFFILIYDF